MARPLQPFPDMWMVSFALVGMLVAISPTAARAQSPTEQIRQQVDQILRTLQDPAFRTRSASDRHAAIRGVADQIFDWTEMSRRALGPHWQQRTPAQREEFVPLFTDVLERAYVSKIESYQGERIQYRGETVDGDHAVVRTTIETPKGQSIPVDYRMLRSANGWKVYDVEIANVSLVANYRTQFNDVIRRASYDELIRRLRARATDTDRASPATGR